MNFYTKIQLLILFCLTFLSVIKTSIAEEKAKSVEKNNEKLQIYPPELEDHLLKGWEENHDNPEYFDLEAFQDNPPFPDHLSDDTIALKLNRRKNDRQLFTVPEDLEPTHNLDDNDEDQVNNVVDEKH